MLTASLKLQWPANHGMGMVKVAIAINEAL
jgi:hypothetical protein